MKNPFSLKICFSVAVSLLFLSGCASTRIIEVPDGTEVEFSSVLKELKGARVVFVGEVHNSRSHHQIQLRIIKAMRRAGIKIAIGLEMFPKEKQEVLDKWVSGELGKGDLIRAYAENWRVPWSLYRPILLYAGKHEVPLVALNVSSEVTHRVFTEGLGALTLQELEGFGSIKCDVDERYEALINEAMGEHEDSEAEYINYCEAQVVWDTYMAKRIVEYLKENPDKTMVVLSGSAHAWKRGIPRRISAMSDITYLVVIPEMSDDIDRDNVTEGDTDFLWLDP